MDLQTQHLEARTRQGQAVGPDAAVGINHRGALTCRKESPQRLNEPLGLRRIDLEKGVGCDAQFDAIKDLQQPGPSRDQVRLWSHDHIGGLGLQVQTNADDLRPALHPTLRQRLQPFELAVTANQGDQDFPRGRAHPQGEVAQAAFATEIDVDGPAGFLKIALDGLNQAIDAGIENGTVVEVDDFVAAAAVVTGPEAPVFGPFQGD